jgi:Ca-activated chloride channel family protein
MDYGAVKMLLDVINVGTVPTPGTDIGEAIRKARGAFNIRERKYKVIILLTDGEDLTQSDPVDAAREAAKDGVRIYTIGIGTRQGELIPLADDHGTFERYKKDREGSIVKTRLVEEPLFQIAELTGGKYYRVHATGSRTEMDSVLEDISELERRELESKEYTQYRERFQVPLMVAVVLLMVEVFLPERRRPGRIESKA